jgi:hypothetical protein
MSKVPNRQLDVLFIEPDCAGVAYQDLSKVCSAIETPTWSLLLAQSCRAKGYGVGILDQTAQRLSDAGVVAIASLRLATDFLRPRRSIASLHA